MSEQIEMWQARHCKRAWSDSAPGWMIHCPLSVERWGRPALAPSAPKMTLWISSACSMQLGSVLA